MLIVDIKIIRVLFIYIVPFTITSVICSDQFDFKKIIEENSHFRPFPDACPLRIYGGNATDISVIPYQIAIRRRNNEDLAWIIICGGALITNLYVLTAAHCFGKRIFYEGCFEVVQEKCLEGYEGGLCLAVGHNRALNRLHITRVVAGTSKSNYIPSTTSNNGPDIEEYTPKDEVWRQIVYVYKHRHYQKGVINHDVAVLELEFPVNFTTTVQPIPMFKYEYGVKIKTPALALVSGFGIMEHGTPSPTLRMVCVPLVTNVECKKHYGGVYVTNWQICAGEWGSGSCQGDSGGPLVYKGYLIGIVSFGGKCATSPGVYTEVAAYTTGEEIPFTRSNGGTLALNTLEIIILVIQMYIYTLFVTVT